MAKNNDKQHVKILSARLHPLFIFSRITRYDCFPKYKLKTNFYMYHVFEKYFYINWRYCSCAYAIEINSHGAQESTYFILHAILIY